MSELNIGKLITTSQQRDAIHVAIAPVEAAERLFGAQRVGLETESEGLIGDRPRRVLLATEAIPAVGIIDPYLIGQVRPGERCWLFLFPNTVTSLRHDWSHPAFDSKDKALDQSESERWIRAFAKSIWCYSQVGEDLFEHNHDPQALLLAAGIKREWTNDDGTLMSVPQLTNEGIAQ